MTQVILARAIQGLGAGALVPLAMAVIGDLVPPSDRRTARETEPPAVPA